MRLNSKQYSNAGPPLVMMHGLFGSLENLGAIARLLAQNYRVYSLDMRNHGRSPHADTMSLAEMAGDVVEFLDEQRLDKVHLLGHSLGGKVMMESALTRPERVSKLVVGDIAPVDYKVPRHDDVFAGIAAVTPSTINNRGQADQQLAEHIQTDSIRSFILKNLERDSQGNYQWRMNVAAIKNSYPQLIGANRSDTQFTGPVLFLKGELSDYLTAEYRNEVVSRFPDAQMKTMGGTGHWLHAEKPELFAKLVSGFLG